MVGTKVCSIVSRLQSLEIYPWNIRLQNLRENNNEQADQYFSGKFLLQIFLGWKTGVY